MSAQRYRSDIDGLRAVAVAAVLFFHLGVGCTGGYVGVDVFFVISGYLITGFVEAALDGGTFSFTQFYLRRVRRLAPALLIMLVPTAVAAWFFLYPEDMRAFAGSLGLQFAALQNFYFLIDGEYFRGSDTKLLLHTWSLAVEEQFYLVWPLVLILTRHVRAGWRMPLIAGVLVASFAINLVLIPISPKASFFMLPTRAWELGAGGVVALIERKGSLSEWGSSASRSVIGALGLGAIAIASFAFTADTVFPGYAALLPVAGTVALIVAGAGGQHVVGDLLGHRAALYLGLISYPLYLWHWPLIAFMHYLHPDPSTGMHAALIVVASVGLADLTYRYVESPIRSMRWLPSPRSLLATVGATGVLLSACAGIAYTTEGAAFRFEPMARAMLTAPFRSQSGRCGFVFRMLHPSAQVCALHEEQDSERRVLLWGNSHAEMWSGALRDLGREHRASVYLNARNCRPTTDSGFCGAHVQDAVLAFVESARVSDVVLASTWYGAYERADTAFEAELADVVRELADRGVRTWLVIDVPGSPAFDPIAAFERDPKRPQHATLDVAHYQQQKQREIDLFARLAAEQRNVAMLDSSVGVCDTWQCAAGRGLTVWYRDANHLTDAGAKAAAREFVRVFKQ